MEIHGVERIAETWRLDKYAVEFIDRDERYVRSSVLYRHMKAYPYVVVSVFRSMWLRSEISCHVDEILAAEMLEHAQSLGVRKFRLTDETTGEEHVLVGLPCFAIVVIEC